MSPIFYEDSLGARLAEKADAAMDAARDQDEELIDDPEALAQAEADVRGVSSQDDYANVSDDWVAVFGPSKLSGILDNAGFNSRLLTAPLETADIPHAWDPYPPEDMPSFRIGYGAVDRPFTLLVPPDRLDEARGLITADVGSAGQFGLPANLERGLEATATRRRGAWTFFLVFVAFDLVVFLIVSVLKMLHVIE